MKGELEDTILISSSSTTAAQERGGARGDIGLHDTFIRCVGGELLGCHAVVLAASSPLLRRTLEDAISSSEEAALVHMPDFSVKEVDNLLNLLYSGACTHTEDLMLLLNILKADESNMKSEKQETNCSDYVKVEAKEEFEDEESDNEQIDKFDSNEISFDEDDESSGDEWKTETNVAKKRQRVKSDKNGNGMQWKPKDTCEKKKGGRPMKDKGQNGSIKGSTEKADSKYTPNKGGRPRINDPKSDEESEGSDFEDSELDTGKKDFVFKKENRLIDKTVNIEVLVNEINKNPEHTLSLMEINEVPIFHYSCEHCEVTFQNILKFSKHMHEEHLDNIHTFNEKYRYYVCFGCSRRFLTINGRTKHMRKVHKDVFYASKEQMGKTSYKPKTTYTCPHCKEHMEDTVGGHTKKPGLEKRIPRTCTREICAEHIIKHKAGEEGLWCNRCPEKFSIIRKLRIHIIEVHNTPDVVCPECGKVFPGGRKFQNHTRYAHGKKEPKPKKEEARESFFCGLCGKVFPKKQALFYHNRVTHDKSKLYSCKVCGKNCFGKAKLDNHASLHLPPTIPCDQCPKMFHTAVYLKRHIASQHTAYGDMPFKCDQCGKGFTLADQLEFHMNVHLNLKPFKCRYCNNCYQNPSNCMSHEKKSHPDLYTKLTKGIGGTRVKDREQLTEEQLGVIRMERTYLDDMGHRRVLNPDEEASGKELKLGPSYQHS